MEEKKREGGKEVDGKEGNEEKMNENREKNTKGGKEREVRLG